MLRNFQVEILEATVSPIKVTSTKVVPLGVNVSSKRSGLIMFTLLVTMKFSNVIPSLSFLWLPHRRLWAFQSIQMTAFLKFAVESLMRSSIWLRLSVYGLFYTERHGIFIFP